MTSEMREKWNEIEDLSKEQIDGAWDDWSKKFDADIDDFYVGLFKDFIMTGKVETSNIIQIQNGTLILKGLIPKERKIIHTLCNQIGLHHNSISTKKGGKKHMHITKPKIWKWEYSERNPYSESDEYYEERNKKHYEKMNRLECRNCCSNGNETTIYASVYIRGLYCEDCLDIVSDGGGGVLSDHKFEPMN